MPDQSDAELVARTLRQDGRAFGALVARYEGLVAGVVHARVRDPEVAKDVVQDAFLTAWRELDRLRDADRIGSWVAGIARNLAATELRRRARRTRLLALAAADGSLGVAMACEEARSLEAELAAISSAHREVLVLYYLEGKSVTEIARLLSVAEPAVKQRLSRGRKELRTLAGIAAAATVTAKTTTAAAGGVAKGAMLMSIKHVVLAAVALVVAVAAVGLLRRGDDGAESSPRTVPVAVANGSSSATVVDAAPEPPPSPGSRRLDATQRASLLDAIRSSYRARSGSAGSVPTSTGAAPALPEAVTVDKEYVRAAVREIVPLLQECYEEGMLRDRSIAGTIAVEFTIEGEPGVGAVVGESVVDNERSTITDPQVRECIQETMHALSLEPPSTGGTVRVRYPFTFRPVEP